MKPTSAEVKITPDASNSSRLHVFLPIRTEKNTQTAHTAAAAASNTVTAVLRCR